MHMIRLIGRGLREAVGVGQGCELPASIRLSLERLGGLNTGCADGQEAGSGGTQTEQQTDSAGAQPPAK